MILYCTINDTNYSNNDNITTKARTVIILVNKN